MQYQWGSSALGAIFTDTPAWSLTLDGDVVTMDVAGRTRGRVPLTATKYIRDTPGVFWSKLECRFPWTAPIVLDGISNGAVRHMQAVLAQARKSYQAKFAPLGRILRDFETLGRPIVEWSSGLQAAGEAQLHTRGWLTADFLAHWQGTQPEQALRRFVDEPELAFLLNKCSESAREAIRCWGQDLAQWVQACNARYLEAELVAQEGFLSRVEKSPLTEEQARAVICFDDRIQVIASAGSGKTSTMIAKAGYAIHRNLVPADRILMLAFNRDAAAELQARVRQRLGAMDYDADAVVARTFHKLGLDIIGEASGKRPTLAPWVENGQDIEHLSALMDQCTQTNPTFRARWGLFRTVFARDLPRQDEPEEPEDWDRDSRTAGFRTLRGEIVKSHGERIIANWLFYNGVDYCYEDPYGVDTADPHHRQYRPDFYYPAINAYHEHWALDEKGEPPPEFYGYSEAMAWKRALHAEHKTTLLETTMAQLWSGEAFDYLARRLTELGIHLDPDPDREPVGQPLVEHRELLKVFRTFMLHAKSNSLDDEALRRRLDGAGPGTFRARQALFLSLCTDLRAAWEKSLRERGFIDFEDMLLRAAAEVEAGRWESPFELVMVDEFQDASQARARLVRALVAKPGTRLFVVGDDWQSINRFAGADVSVMTGFERAFGSAQVYRLEQSFRCPQSLCDLSSRFIQQNPGQIRKTVRSRVPEHPPTVRIWQVPQDDQIEDAVRTRLRELHAGVADGTVPPATDGRVRVLVLGRYRRDRQHLPAVDFVSDRLDVKFMTMHGSKGLEADYVILPRVVAGGGGFPSKQHDDPVLDLAMPAGETFPNAEERRLFYVALTRARRSVLVITVENRLSPFLTELIRDQGMEVTAVGGSAAAETRICPQCRKGQMVPRSGPYGPFLGCSRFPKCRHTMKR